eukprot:3489063-Amphidinium_carterae.1
MLKKDNIYTCYLCCCLRLVSADLVPASGGYAFRTSGMDRCAVSYFGDGAASEGDFVRALAT